MAKMTKDEIKQTVCVMAYSAQCKNTDYLEKFPDNCEVHVLEGKVTQARFAKVLSDTSAELILLLDLDRLDFSAVKSLVSLYNRECLHQEVGYCSHIAAKTWGGAVYRNYGQVEADVLVSPFLIVHRKWMERAYAGEDLASFITAVAYSLQQVGGVVFKGLPYACGVTSPVKTQFTRKLLGFRYFFRLPLRYLTSGEFFKSFLKTEGKMKRDMVFRFLFVLFSCFSFFYMPWVSRDYGVTGDEFVDHRHVGYVLDYFAEGDTTALYQPKTALHLYGNSVQVVAGAICRWFDIDQYHEVRHMIGGIVGALGILVAGLAGLRWGGGFCGLVTLLLMFFTPRFFGHSMNNLKDIPFAVGYMVALYYTIRFFDYFPYFRFRHIAGVVAGIALALGTRSGGLILYPMFFMYAGLFYIRYVGIKECYKLRKYMNLTGRTISVMLFVVVVSYLLAISLWPFALQKPFTNVLYSLERFTNYSIGLRTIFDGKQMMSNMLPWEYAPKYLYIGMPLVTVSGFFGYIVYLLWRRKEFSLMAYFFLFAVIFPVFWVVYKNSNLYGGIRHLLFVMPPMVVIAGRFWTQMINSTKIPLKIGCTVLFVVLFSLPVAHAVKNHPNEYVYFNELAGGLKGAYGNYETDYYFNSLKQSADWFKKNILPTLPADRKTIIVTQGPLDYYFRKDTNIQVVYTRYYEKHAKEWDYAIFGNVYINRFQLQNGLFPPAGNLYSPLVDGYPVSCVLQRQSKAGLEGYQLEKEKQPGKALEVFEEYIQNHQDEEEVWGRMAKLYYMVGNMDKGKEAVARALQLHPSLNEALYISALINLNLKDYNAAFESVNKMLAENSSSVDAYFLRATIYYSTHDYSAAIRDLNKILSIRPKYDRALVLAGDIFKQTGNYTQAVAMYQKALRIKNAVSTQVAMADAWCRAEKYDQAEEILKEMIRVQSSYLPIYKVKLRMFLQQNKLAETALLLRQLQSVRRDAELFVLRAMYAERIQDRETMQWAVEQALKLDPGNAEALKLQKK